MALILNQAVKKAFGLYPTSPMQFDFDAGGGSNRIVIMAIITASNTTNQITSVTYGGTPMVSAGPRHQWQTHDWMELFYLLNAPAGINQVSISFDTDVGEAAIVGLSYPSVAAINNYALQISGGTTTPSRTVTTAVGDDAVVISFNDSNYDTSTPGSGVIEDLDGKPDTPGTQNLVGCFVGRKTATTTSTVIDWTPDSGLHYPNTFVFSLTPGAGGGSTQSPRSMHIFNLMRK